MSRLLLLGCLAASPALAGGVVDSGAGTDTADTAETGGSNTDEANNASSGAGETGGVNAPCGCRTAGVSAAAGWMLPLVGLVLLRRE